MRGAAITCAKRKPNGRAKIDATIAVERPPVMNENVGWRKQAFDMRVRTDEHANES
jgi:hypothetical protein